MCIHELYVYSIGSEEPLLTHYLLYILQLSGQLPIKKNYCAQNVTSAEVEKHCVRPKEKKVSDMYTHA